MAIELEKNTLLPHRNFFSSHEDFLEEKEPDEFEPTDLDLAEIEKGKAELDPEDLEGKAGTVDPLRIYLKEIRKAPLLTHAQEIDLGAKICQSKKAKKTLSLPSISKEERQEAEQQILDGEAARKILVESNLRLVVSTARGYISKGLPLPDLIQEGNIELMRTVEKFDHTRGFKFSTYATWWIRQAITRALADQSRTIRIPVHMVETINRFNRAQRKLMQDLGREPTPEEVAKELGIDPAKAWGIIKVSQEPTSLATKVGDEEDSELGDFIEDKHSPTTEEAAATAFLAEELQQSVGQLPDNCRRVLQLRFGLKDGKQRTLEEVGKEFGVTRERIRQIEAQAIKKLQYSKRADRLRDYYEN